MRSRYSNPDAMTAWSRRADRVSRCQHAGSSIQEFRSGREQEVIATYTATPYEFSCGLKFFFIQKSFKLGE